MNNKIQAKLFLLVLIVIGSCQKKSDPQPAAAKCYVSKVTEAGTGITGTSTFTYNYSSDHVLTSISGEEGYKSTTNFTYDANGNLITIEKGGYTKNITYDAQNRVTKYSNNNPDGSVFQRFEFTYNASGQMIKEDIYNGNINGGESYFGYITYQYANSGSKNPSGSKQYGANGSLYITQVLTFDDKPSPFASTMNTMVAYMYFYNLFYFNNLTQNAPVGGSTTTVTYEYGSNGYPTKVVSTFVSNTKTMTFEYDCQ